MTGIPDHALRIEQSGPIKRTPDDVHGEYLQLRLRLEAGPSTAAQIADLDAVHQTLPMEVRALLNEAIRARLPRVPAPSLTVTLLECLFYDTHCGRAEVSAAVARCFDSALSCLRRSRGLAGLETWPRDVVDGPAGQPAKGRS